MIEGVIIKKLEQYNDQRGWLTEIFRHDEMEFRPVMAYVSVTKPGVARGPHEHREQADCFVFVGPGEFKLYLWDNRKDSPTFGEHYEEVFGETNKAAAIIPPGVVHGYKCVSEVSGQVTNLTSELYKGEGKRGEIDEIRWEIDPASPFKIN